LVFAADFQDRLARFVEILTTWNRKINLVGRSTSDLVLTRHVEDSLAVLPLLPATVRRIVDLGSGGGLPGFVVALATGIDCHLVDRDQRKCAFLREAGRVACASVVVHAADFEALPPVAADVILSRATGSLDLLLGAGVRHGRKGGVMVFHKSTAQWPEVDTARARWRFAIQRFANASDDRGELWRVSQVEPRHG
jgi:16S rRNA (guanine527-N7)-methyltransferase